MGEKSPPLERSAQNLCPKEVVCIPEQEGGIIFREEAEDIICYAYDYDF